VLNGIVGPTLEPHPGAWEVKQVQAPVSFDASPEMLAAGKIRVKNKHQFLDLSGFAVKWSVCENGRTTPSGKAGHPSAGGEFILPAIPAGESAEIELGYKLPKARAGAEYWLNVDCVLKEATSWAEAGHVVSWAQFELPVKLLPAVAPYVKGKFAYGKGVCRVGETELGVDEGTGIVKSFRYKGVELIQSGLVESFYRAPLDNDWICNNGNSYESRWKAAGLDRLVRKVVWGKSTESPGFFGYFSGTELTGTDSERPIQCENSFELLADGGLFVQQTVEIPRSFPVVPRVGMGLVMPAGFENVKWYGRGPWENYVDRKSAARVGEYATRVGEMLTEYIVPGECGGREDARWLEIRNAEGVGLRFEGSPVFHFSALHAGDAELERATHFHEIELCAETHVHIDALHMGVGGDTGWTPNVHPEYLIQPGIYRWAFTMRGVG